MQMTTRAALLQEQQAMQLTLDLLQLMTVYETLPKNSLVASLIALGIVMQRQDSGHTTTAVIQQCVEEVTASLASITQELVGTPRVGN